MKKNKNLMLLISALAVILMLSCEKQKEIKLDSVNTETQQASTNLQMMSIATPYFDWENSDYVPTPPGTVPILVPWASGSNQLFPDEIAFDYKNADGWNLVYNTFSTTQLTSPNFFALYNKYRGIIRFYLYIQPGNLNASSYFSDGLAVSGSLNSTLINYSNEIVDLQNPLKSLTRIQNYRVQSTGAWYACQYEIAYDPNISNANPQNLNFIWNTSSTNISNVSLNGESNGTLTGTVGTESPGGFNLGNLLGEGLKGALYFTGFKAIDAIKGINAPIKESLLSGAKSGLSGAVKGFLNAILGGSPTAPQMVNLTLQTKMNLTGSITNTSGIASPTLAIPGASNASNTVGYLPLYNEPLGVFYMTARPKIYVGSGYVTVNRTNVNLGGLQEYILSYDPSIKTPRLGLGDVARFSRTFINEERNKTLIVFNPKLIAEGTTFKILREDIVVPIDTPPPFYFTEFGPQFTDHVIDLGGSNAEDRADVYKAMEKIGEQDYAVFGSNYAMETAIYSFVHPTNGQKFIDNVRYKDACIRYTILVTPPNGAAPVTIVKTFKAEKLVGPNSISM